MPSSLASSSGFHALADRIRAAIYCAMVVSLWSGVLRANTGELEIRVVDDVTNKQIGARMTMTRANGKPYRPPDTPNFHNHFLVNGQIILTLPVGTYNFEIERGAEYLEQVGHFTIERGATDTKIIRLKRFVDMRQLGWWTGDLAVRRDSRDIEAILFAEDLAMAAHVWDGKQPVKHPWQRTDAGLNYWTPGDQRYVVSLHIDERAGGTLYAAGLPHDWRWSAKASAEYPSSVDFLKAAKKAGHAHLLIGEPFAWDLPIWIASQQTEALVLLGPFLTPSPVNAKSSAAGPTTGRPRDTVRFKGIEGVGRYSEDIYFQLLNCGLRIPPTAASGSGVSRAPAGAQRIYVHCGETMDVDRWWSQLLEGRVVVTNGPILLPQVNGELPGHVFSGYPGEPVRLKPTLTLHTRVKIAYLEIIKDGSVIHEVRLDQLRDRRGDLPGVDFDRSGWMAIRAVADDQQAYRGVTCGPFYVKIGDEPRISRRSVQYFIDWLQDRTQRVDLPPGDERDAVMRYHLAARSYWEKLLAKANDD